VVFVSFGGGEEEEAGGEDGGLDDGGLDDAGGGVGFAAC
jgi:hypothetical protein